MNYTQLPIRDEYLPGNAERREARPLGKKVAKKRRQAGLVADGRRASPRTNVIAVRCGPGLRTRKLEGTVLPLPHCRLSTSTFDFAGSMACSRARARRVEGDGRVEKEIHESRARTGQKLKNPANPPVRTHTSLDDIPHPSSSVERVVPAKLRPPPTALPRAPPRSAQYSRI